jgi:hypothetical protein
MRLFSWMLIDLAISVSLRLIVNACNIFQQNLKLELATTAHLCCSACCPLL